MLGWTIKMLGRTLGRTYIDLICVVFIEHNSNWQLYFWLVWELTINHLYKQQCDVLDQAVTLIVKAKHPGKGRGKTRLIWLSVKG